MRRLPGEAPAVLPAPEAPAPRSLCYQGSFLEAAQHTMVTLVAAQPRVAYFPASATTRTGFQRAQIPPNASKRRFTALQAVQQQEAEVAGGWQ